MRWNLAEVNDARSDRSQKQGDRPTILRRGVRRLEHGRGGHADLASLRSHDWPEDGPTGPQAFRNYYAAIRVAVPDARYEVDDLIAEDDRVVVRWKLRGTHKGDFGGIPASGRPIALNGIAIYRVDGGQLMERWVVSDLHGLLEEVRQR